MSQLLQDDWWEQEEEEAMRFVPAVVFLLRVGKTKEVLSVLNEQIHSEQDENSSTLDLGFAVA